MIEGIPAERYWPKGFTTDFVTGFPDAPLLFHGTWWKPWTWFDWRRVDLRVAAWWHDLRYFLGYAIPRTFPEWLLPFEKPRPNHARSDIARAVCDELLEKDFIAAGMHPKTARIACDIIVEFAGREHYWWATADELNRRGL